MNLTYNVLHTFNIKLYIYIELYFVQTIVIKLY